MTDKKSKTAMQELIEVLEGYFGKDHFKAINFQSKLDKEREQIINAYNKGEDDTLNDVADRTGNSLMMKFVKPNKVEAVKYFKETYEP